MSSRHIDSYNVVWKSASRDASESMPCGCGDIGLNGWVENGDVLFYISRSGSLDELNEYLKLGRVRLRLDPNPFEKCDDTFRQELVLREGNVEIRGGDVAVKIWVEIHRPIVHIAVGWDREFYVTATYENWRLTEEVLPDDTRRHALFDIVAYPGEVRLSLDNVSHADGGVLFYHCNPPDNWLGELKIR